MSITTKRWDSAQHLKTEEDIQFYIEACMEEIQDNPSFIVHALGVVAKARGMTKLSKDTGLSREGLYKALSPQGNPAFATVLKIAKALGFKLSMQSDSNKISV